MFKQLDLNFSIQIRASFFRAGPEMVNSLLLELSLKLSRWEKDLTAVDYMVDKRSLSQQIFSPKNISKEEKPSQ